MLHAIIDIGSNTIRRAVYQIEGDAFTMLMKRKHTAGLAGCLADGRLTREGVDLTVKILGGFVDLIDALGISRVHAFATAALRSAVNSRAAVGEIARRTGVQVRIISGEEEAAYDFGGATQNIAHADGIMADIGGGSTEIVSFAGGTMQERWSLPLGSLALRRVHVMGLFPTPAECAAIEADVRDILAETPAVCALRAQHLVGLGGVLSSTSRLHALLYLDEPQRCIAAVALAPMIAMLGSGRPLEERDTALLLRAAPDRLHNIVPGMIIARVLAETFAAEDITCSDGGVREGYIRAEIL
ncbi:MAG: phosphatase [Selenomonas sp.]|nr:phosphatase [Selenomonas sp.]